MNTSRKGLNLSGKKILLVEHDRSIRLILNDTFYKMDSVVINAVSIAEALRYFKQDRFDVVISEFDLLGESGLEFFKSIKQTNPAVVTVLITDYGEIGSAAEALESGVDHIIEKPFSMNRLLDTISTRLSSPHDARGRSRTGRLAAQTESRYMYYDVDGAGTRCISKRLPSFVLTHSLCLQA